VKVLIKTIAEGSGGATLINHGKGQRIGNSFPVPSTKHVARNPLEDVFSLQMGYFPLP